jgi:hypothetical protein
MEFCKSLRDSVEVLRWDFGGFRLISSLMELEMD